MLPIVNNNNNNNSKMMMTMTICKEGSHLLQFSLRWEFMVLWDPSLGILCGWSVTCILNGGLRTACSQGGNRGRPYREWTGKYSKASDACLQGCVCIYLCVWRREVVCKLILT